jgi:hypothetical protein
MAPQRQRPPSLAASAEPTSLFSGLAILTETFDMLSGNE